MTMTTNDRIKDLNDDIDRPKMTMNQRRHQHQGQASRSSPSPTSSPPSSLRHQSLSLFQQKTIVCCMMVGLLVGMTNQIPTVNSFAIGRDGHGHQIPTTAAGPTSTTFQQPSHQRRRQLQLFCQLLGMNCATPTDFTFSFKGFCQRGGETDVHSDGWGIAFYQPDNNGIRQFHDVEPASTSSLAEYLSQHANIRTHNMMGHIRYATVGQVELSNVHPFSREMWGIQWCFCHNGEVPLYKNQPQTQGDCVRELTALMNREDRDSDDDDDNSSVCFYHPVGSTDSEATFCAILNALRNKFQALPSLPVLYEAIQALSAEIVSHDPSGTILNFLLTCGPHAQWVYSWPGSRPGSKVWNGLHYTTRQYPFSKCHLCDLDYTVDFRTCTTSDDCVSVIATKPLTDDEEWVELKPNELLLFDGGKPYQTPKDLFQVELSGHGLHSKVMAPPKLEQDMRGYNLDPQHFQGECI